MSKEKSNQPPDGRKYRLSLISLLVILTAFGIAILNPVFVGLYSELVAGVLAILFVYCGGNVGKSWAVGKKDGLTVSSGGTKVIKGPPPGAK